MANIPIEEKMKTPQDLLREIVFKSCRFDKEDQHLCDSLIKLAQKKDTGNTITVEFALSDIRRNMNFSIECVNNICAFLLEAKVHKADELDQYVRLFKKNVEMLIERYERISENKDELICLQIQWDQRRHVTLPPDIDWTQWFRSLIESKDKHIFHEELFSRRIAVLEQYIIHITKVEDAIAEVKEMALKREKGKQSSSCIVS